MFAGQALDTPPTQQSTVSPVNASCLLILTAPAATVHPFCQPPVAGVRITLVLRSIASLRDRVNPAFISNAAVLTRCPAMNEVMEGRASTAKIPATTTVTINSAKVKPRFLRCCTDLMFGLDMDVLSVRSPARAQRTGTTDSLCAQLIDGHIYTFGIFSQLCARGLRRDGVAWRYGAGCHRYVVIFRDLRRDREVERGHIRCVLTCIKHVLLLLVGHRHDEAFRSAAIGPRDVLDVGRISNRGEYGHDGYNNHHFR